MTITAHQRRSIAVEAICDDRSVRRTYAGRPTRSVTLARIVEAAQRLRLPLPPGGAERLALDGEAPAPHAA